MIGSGSVLQGKGVHIFGDSHVENMAPGKHLLAELEKQGAPAWSNGLKNRSAISVLRDEKATLDGELAIGPHIVLLVLGTNDVPSTNTAVAYQTLKKTIENAGAEAWLVGPPHFPTDLEEKKALQNVALEAPIFGATWINSMSIIDRRTEGRIAPTYVHFDDVGGRRWAEGIVKELVARLAARGRKRWRAVLGIATGLAAACVAGVAVARMPR